MICPRSLTPDAHLDGRLQVVKDRYPIDDIRCGAAAHRRKAVAAPEPVTSNARSWNAWIAVCDGFRWRVASPEQQI